MDERIRGVSVYGGNPQHHSVFNGQEQRQHRQTVLKSILATVLSLVFIWCIRSAFIAIAEPPQATADTDAAQVQMDSGQAAASQSNGSAPCSDTPEAAY
jgi:hypothetical protein